MADRISELPDELLLNILSRLAMREAVATSFISRRWKHLWTHSTGSFYLGSGLLTEMKQTRDFSFLKTERARYIERIYKFTRSHKGPTIDAFMIIFDLRPEASEHINNWVDFAMKKLVCTLQLDLALAKFHPPTSTLFLEIMTKNWVYAFPSLESDPNYQNLNLSRLRSLSLDTVHISRETVEYILTNSPALEYLCISISPGFTGIRVVATCPKLKHLEISYCQRVGFVEISSAPSLAFFSYNGPKNTRLCFGDAPNLVEVSLQGDYCLEKIMKFHELPLALSQIQKLKLHASTKFGPCFNKFPKLLRVTELELNFGKCLDDCSLLSCANVIRACPNLHSLSVQLIWLRGPAPRAVEKMEQGKGVIYKRLKVVEFDGFRGTATDVELVTHILLRSPLVEKIKVDTINLDVAYIRPSVRYGDEMKNHAKKLASLLASKFSPSAELHVQMKEKVHMEEFL